MELCYGADVLAAGLVEVRAAAGGEVINKVLHDCPRIHLRQTFRLYVVPRDDVHPMRLWRHIVPPPNRLPASIAFHRYPEESLAACFRDSSRTACFSCQQIF